MAVVYPGAGEEAEVANRLLELAENPADVKVTTDTADSTGHVAFIVPDDLLDAYLADRDSDDAEENKPKRRGRPRKVAEAPKTTEE